MIRRSIATAAAIALVVLLALVLTANLWLPLVGNFLVKTDGPAKAEVVVVLAGDYDGRRVLKGYQLVEEGYAPRVLVNGAGMAFGLRECDLAVDFAVRKGVPREALEPLCLEAQSTLEEALETDDALRRRGVRKALVVTSDFHTRRARRIYRKFASGDVSYRFVAAPTRDFDPDSWWRSREGRKILLLEYLKTLNSWFERPKR